METDVNRNGRHFDEMEESERVRPNLAEQACRTLWAAVLAQAVEDMLSLPPDVSQLQSGSMGRSRRYAYGESMQNQHELLTSRVSTWLFEDGLYDVGSFRWICDALGLDMAYVRRKAKERRMPMRTFMTVR